MPQGVFRRVMYRMWRRMTAFCPQCVREYGSRGTGLAMTASDFMAFAWV